MINKKIGIDLDGVLADFSNGFSNLIRKYYGIAENPIVKSGSEMITHWDWYHWYPNFTKDKSSFLWNLIGREESNFWYNLPTTDEAKDLNLQDLSRKNYLFFITNRPENKVVSGDDFISVQSESSNWIYRHIRLYSSPNVIVAADKGPIIKALDLDYYIDDKYENCKDAYNYSPKTKVYMPKMGHNQREDLEGITVIDSILDFPPFKEQ